MTSRFDILKSVKCVFLAGEGPNELGSWAEDPIYRKNYPGVIETLMDKVKNTGWKITHAVKWKNIRKFKAGEHRSPEERNVLGACLLAKENNCNILAFSRDSDCDDNRIRDINKGISDAVTIFSPLGILGGCAVPTLESWILALAGELRTEERSKPRLLTILQEKGVNPKDTAQMVEFVKKLNLQSVAKDAHSLVEWIKTARKVL
jgi:hypothetical protein